MIELDDMRLFRALGGSRSLAAAARLLNLTPPAVSVRLQRLEERLGLQLAVREARGVTLTDEGLKLLDESIDILERIESIASRVAEQSGSVSGHLRIVAPFGFGRAHVAPLVRRLHLSYPNLGVSLVLAESPLSAASGADVVLSIGAAKSSSWVSHFLAPNERFLCASPEFVRRIEQLDHPADLQRYEYLTLRENDEDVTRLRFMPAGDSHKPGAKGITVRLSGALSSNDGTVISEWAANGLGVIERSEWSAAGSIASGKLVRLLPQWRLEPAPILALLPSRHAVTNRQRLFLEAAKRAFDPAPWRQAAGLDPGLTTGLPSVR
ncbi:LysR family transcriptional regulator (plasmid) [Paraburkholderia graminis]|uniref:LysR substrate-binding domain-containing protein n=1 Tax=Paraburkholderia graminis TaxID=60548 RepID=UPI000DEFE8D9|nr:LysR substrate-binding domain-containing protein [Paraburkholderia graminis]AXF12550.1 LysR family transcriptional regulator [Paraburkholderia graminis]